MGLTEPDQILFANKRFSAGVEKEIAAQLIGLVYDAVQLLIGQVHLISVFRRPAAGTMQVAGRSGIHQNSPRNVAVILLCQLIMDFSVPEGGVDDKVFKYSTAHLGIHIGENVQNQPVPVVIRVFQDLIAESWLLRARFSGINLSMYSPSFGKFSFGFLSIYSYIIRSPAVCIVFISSICLIPFLVNIIVKLEKRMPVHSRFSRQASGLCRDAYLRFVIITPMTRITATTATTTTFAIVFCPPAPLSSLISLSLYQPITCTVLEFHL